MDFHLDCECGRSASLTEASAGGRWTCDCGREVAVPSLSEMRRRHGQSSYAVDPAGLVQSMVAAGELPTDATCVHCGTDTDEVARLLAECEKRWTHHRGGSHPGALWLVSSLLGPWVGGAATLEPSDPVIVGKDVVVAMPLRICRRCQQQLPRHAGLAVLRVLSYALAAVGVAALTISSVFGALVLGLGALIWWLGETIAARRQATFHWLLRRVPVYGQLLDKYPDAQITRAP